MTPAACWRAMQVAVRNLGREGLAATAISAVDVALWDLKAKLLNVPLATCWALPRRGADLWQRRLHHLRRPQLAHQLGGWVEQRRLPLGQDEDRHRSGSRSRAASRRPKRRSASARFVRRCQRRLSPSSRRCIWRNVFAAEQDVRWFEEPVSSDDLDGLRRVRERAPPRWRSRPANMVTTLDYFRRMLAPAPSMCSRRMPRAAAASRVFAAAALCEAHHIDLSAHCAPALHLHLGCAAPRFRHLEWFHDHVRIERMLFDGAPVPKNGAIRPDFFRPGTRSDVETAGRRAVRGHDAVLTALAIALQTPLSVGRCRALPALVDSAAVALRP